MLTVNLDKALHDLGHNAVARTDYTVFMSLTEYMDMNGTITVPQNLIAKETGYARRTVSNSIHRLQEKGFLTIEKSMENSHGIVRGIPSNIYHINPQYLVKTEDTEPKSSAQYPAQPCSDVRRLARLGEVLTTVIHDLLAAYEEKSNK